MILFQKRIEWKRLVCRSINRVFCLLHHDPSGQDSLISISFHPPHNYLYKDSIQAFPTDCESHRSRITSSPALLAVLELQEG